MSSKFKMVDSCLNCATPLLIDSDGSGGRGGGGGQSFIFVTNSITGGSAGEKDQEIVSIKQAINIIFEAALKLAKVKISKHFAEEEEVLCINCAQILHELYNYYTKFMRLSTATSRFARLIKKSSLWSFSSIEEEEEHGKGNSRLLTNKKLLHSHVKHQTATKVESQSQSLNLQGQGHDESQNADYDDNWPEPESETEVFIKQEPVNFDLVEEEASIFSPNPNPNPNCTKDIGNKRLRVKLQKLSEESLLKNISSIKVKKKKKKCQSGLKKKYSKKSSQKIKTRRRKSTKQWCESCRKYLIGSSWNLQQHIFHRHTNLNEQETDPPTPSIRRRKRRVTGTQLPYSCSSCSKAFPTELLLEKHILFNHGKSYDDDGEKGKAPLKTSSFCQQCNKYFTNQLRLKKHNSLEHPDQIPSIFTCHACPKSYTRAQSLAAHVATTHKKVNSAEKYCSLCNKYLTSSYHLKRHVAMIHDKVDPQTGEPLTPTPCPICGKSILHALNMRRHMKLVHPSPNDPNVRPYQCETCGAAFKTTDSLKKHLSSDAHGHKDKKYKCVSCNHSYATQARLDRHLKFHEAAAAAGMGMDNAEVARHKCAECGKIFHTHCNLKKHIRSLHPPPDELLKPSHVCSSCGAAFKYKSYLAKHVKQVCRIGGVGGWSLDLGSNAGEDGHSLGHGSNSGNENLESTSASSSALQLQNF